MEAEQLQSALAKSEIFVLTRGQQQSHYTDGSSRGDSREVLDAGQQAVINAVVDYFESAGAPASGQRQGSPTPAGVVHSLYSSGSGAAHGDQVPSALTEGLLLAGNGNSGRGSSGGYEASLVSDVLSAADQQQRLGQHRACSILLAALRAP